MLLTEVIVCKGCGSARNLISPVEKVIGTFTEPTRWDSDARRLYLKIWNEDTKKALHAEIDMLKITQETTEWAISEWINTWLSHETTSGKKISIIYAPDAKPSENSMRLLASIEK